MLEYLSLTILGYVAAISPGPDAFFVVKNGLLYGLRGSLSAFLGIATGNIVYLSLVYFGLASLARIPLFVGLVSLFGGCYLVYLGIMSLKEKTSPEFKRINEKEGATFSAKNIYLKAITLNLSNPKAILFFSSVLAPFLKGNLFLSLIFLYAGIVGAFLTLAISSALLSLFKKFQKIFLFLNQIVGILFLLFALGLFWEAFNSLKKLF